jgi:hypothetical protein
VAATTPDVEPLRDRQEFGGVVTVIAAFAMRRPDLNPDPRQVSHLTSGLVRAVRTRELGNDKTLAETLVATGQHLSLGKQLTVLDRQALDQLARVAQREALSANERAFGRR